MSLVQLFVQEYVLKSSLFVSDYENLIILRLFIPAESTESTSVPYLYQLLFNKLSTLSATLPALASVRTANSSVTPDLTHERVWFDICLAQYDYDAVSDIASALENHWETVVSPVMTHRCVQIVEHDAALYTEGDINTQFVDVYSRFAEEGMTAAAAAIAGSTTGATRDALLNGVKPLLECSVAELWMRKTLTVFDRTKLTQNFPTVSDVCRCIYLFYKYDIGNMFTRMDMSYTVIGGVESLDCMVNDADEDVMTLANIKNNLAYKLHQQNTDKRTTDEYLKGIEKSFEIQKAKVSQDATYHRSRVVAEARLLVVTTALSIAFTLWSLYDVTTMHGYFAVCLAICFLVLITLEGGAMMRKT